MGGGRVGECLKHEAKSRLDDYLRGLEPFADRPEAVRLRNLKVWTGEGLGLR